MTTYGSRNQHNQQHFYVVSSNSMELQLSFYHFIESRSDGRKKIIHKYDMLRDANGQCTLSCDLCFFFLNYSWLFASLCALSFPSISQSKFCDSLFQSLIQRKKIYSSESLRALSVSHSVPLQKRRERVRLQSI